MFDRKIIDTYASGGQKLREAVRGLSREQLAAFPVPGTWSIQQIVVHLNAADAVGIERMKRIAAMDNPLMLGYDENLFAKQLFYEAQPVEQVLDLFDLNRRLWSITLRALPEEAFERTGIHSERGRVSLGALVVDHLDHHLSFIDRKRRMLS